MIVLAALLASFAGFAALAFAMDKHHRDMTGALPKGRRLTPFRVGGWALLLLACAAMIAGYGPAIGPIYALGVLTVSGLCVAMALTYRPRLLPLFSRIALPLSLCAAVLAGVS